MQVQPTRGPFIIGAGGLYLRTLSDAEYDDCLVDLIAKMGLTVTAPELREIAVLGYSQQTARQADRSALSAGAVAFLETVEKEYDDATRKDKKDKKAKGVIKLRLALCAALQLIYVIGEQTLGTMMHWLVNRVGARWAKEHRELLHAYNLKITEVLARRPL